MQIDDASSAADAADILGVFDDRVPPQAPLPWLRCPAEASLTPRARPPELAGLARGLPSCRHRLKPSRDAERSR